jgi:hypothetical protein
MLDHRNFPSCPEELFVRTALIACRDSGSLFHSVIELPTLVQRLNQCNVKVRHSH